MRRRTAIKTLGALGAAAAAPRFLSGCGDDLPGPATVDHIVVMMMENRSYDHMLGSRSLVEGLGGDGMPAGAANPNKAGQMVSAFPAQELCVLDPPHSWDAAREQLDGGKCDGFIRAYQDAQGAAANNDTMSYLTRDIVPVTYALADAGTTCDRWFSSVLGPTWPNRMYLHSAQSDGLKANDIPENGFSWKTIYHRLSAAGIDWAYYFSDVPILAVIEDLDLSGHIRRVMNDFLDDAAKGQLPRVAVVDPAFTSNDDHPPHHPGLGQQFLSLIYGALARSPQWSRTMMVLTYDEHGGFFDHVVPPMAADDRADQGFSQLGFRVPALVMGPWVKGGQVSSVVHDHTSVLAHIEHMFGLEPLTARDAAAADLSDCLDTERMAAGGPALAPAEVPAVEIDESQITDRCMGSSLRQTDHDVLRWADQANLPPEWDRRGEVRDMLFDISGVLDRWGLGRIRRGR